MFYWLELTQMTYHGSIFKEIKRFVNLENIIDMYIIVYHKKQVTLLNTCNSLADSFYVKESPEEIYKILSERYKVFIESGY